MEECGFGGRSGAPTSSTLPRCTLIVFINGATGGSDVASSWPRRRRRPCRRKGTSPGTAGRWRCAGDRWRRVVGRANGCRGRRGNARRRPPFRSQYSLEGAAEDGPVSTVEAFRPCAVFVVVADGSFHVALAGQQGSAICRRSALRTAISRSDFATVVAAGRPFGSTLVTSSRRRRDQCASVSGVARSGRRSQFEKREHQLTCEGNRCRLRSVARRYARGYDS